MQMGECMRKSALIGAIVATLLSGIASAQAGPWEDGMVAYNRGDAQAKAGLRDVSKAMTPAEISQARQMAQACEASNYRGCEY
jgi:hypothetical protein